MCRGVGFLRRAWRGRWGMAGLRLRSGAFAPDFPFVILVAACRRLPSDSLGRIYTPRAPPAADATGYSVITSPARGRIVCLVFWRQTGAGRKIWRGRQNRPRGRPSLAFGGKVGRDAEESVRQCQRCSAWRNPGCIARHLPRQPFFLRSGARQARHAHASPHRAPPLSSPRLDGTPSKQPATRAQRQRAKPRHRVSCGRPPARPPATGISNLVKFPRSCSAPGQEKRSSSGRRPGRRATSMRPTESEGSRRQAATRMRQGRSGANAPDRNRGRPPPGPPARRAA
ncbi:Uncharacterised protein [Achromobacter xylosoxidans]|nr:Uncharacterised protein [Achromobacter xylosoxidans]